MREDPRVSEAIARAEECLASGREDLAAGRAHRAASSLYFAVFNACLAALIARGVETNTHAHAQSEFHRLLVKPGLIPSAEGRVYNQLMTVRGRADYDLSVRLSRERVDPLVEPAQKLVNKLIKLTES